MPEAAIARIASIRTEDDGVVINIADRGPRQARWKVARPELTVAARRSRSTSCARASSERRARRRGQVARAWRSEGSATTRSTSRSSSGRSPTVSTSRRRPRPCCGRPTRRARELIDRQSRRRGMSRRDFLRTSMATAAVFVALDACTSDEHTARTGRKPGGHAEPSRGDDRRPRTRRPTRSAATSSSSISRPTSSSTTSRRRAATSAAASRRRRAAKPTRAPASRSTTTSRRCSCAPTPASRW